MHTLAISRPIMETGDAKPLLHGLLRTAKELIEKASGSSMASVNTQIQERVTEIIRRTCSYVEERFSRKANDPHLDKKLKINPEIIIAQTNREAAEARAEGYVFPIGRYASEHEFIIDKTKNPAKGTYDNNFSRLILNLQAIRMAHETRQEQQACIVATTVHETSHHLGDLEDIINWMLRYTVCGG